MTAQETIDRLNDALSKLVKAYKELQAENENLKKEIDTLSKIKADLEYRLSEYEDISEVQSSKINSMLDLVQSVINNKEDEKIISSTTSENTEASKEEFAFDIKIDQDLKEEKNISNEEDIFDKDEKFDIDRMESLIDRLKS